MFKVHENLYKIDSKGKVRVFFIEQPTADSYVMVTGIHEGNLVRTKPTVCKPKFVGKSNETSAPMQAASEIKSKYEKKLKEKYFTTIAAAKAGTDIFFSPMLATEWSKIKEDKRKFPYIADTKLDGMRLIVTVDEAHSRTGREVPCSQHIYEELRKFLIENPNYTIDGEIYNHNLKSDFDKLMSLARKQNPTPLELAAAAAQLEYHIYDIYDADNPNMPAIERKELLDELFATVWKGSNVLKPVKWQIVKTQEQLDNLALEHLVDGYEGTILRVMDSPYVNKRTKDLIKVKQFKTEEFIIVDVLEGDGNRSGMAGKISVVSKDGMIKSDCGIRGNAEKFTHIFLNKDNYPGKECTVRHFGVTQYNSLRHPVVIDIDRWAYE